MLLSLSLIKKIMKWLVRRPSRWKPLSPSLTTWVWSRTYLVEGETDFWELSSDPHSYHGNRPSFPFLSLGACYLKDHMFPHVCSPDAPGQHHPGLLSLWIQNTEFSQPQQHFLSPAFLEIILLGSTCLTHGWEARTRHWAFCSLATLFPWDRVSSLNLKFTSFD